jgi:hypothetical protein
LHFGLETAFQKNVANLRQLSRRTASVRISRDYSPECRFADALYESGDTGGGGEIAGNALDFDLRHVLREPLYRGVNAPLGAAIEHHRCASSGQTARNGEPDARS